MLSSIVASQARILHLTNARRIPDSLNAIFSATSARDSHSNVRPALQGDSLPEAAEVTRSTVCISEREPHSAPNVTVVTSEATSCAAIKALLKISEQNKPVAWNIQRCISTEDVENAAAQQPVIAMSAYAGHDVDFGNGPHLFIRGQDGTIEYMEQFKRYFELNNCLRVWCDYSSSLNLLASVGIRPNGLYHDIRSMDFVADTGIGRPKVENEYFQYITNKYLQNPSVRVDHSSSMNAVCNNAALLYSIHQRIVSLLRQTDLHGFNSPPEYKRDIRSVLDTYYAFFRHVDEALAHVERAGVHVNISSLQDSERRLLEQMRVQERNFLSWSSQQCSAAKFMDPHNTAQLKHLLFAPCRNAIDPLLKLPEKKTITARTSKEESSNVKKKSKRVISRKVELQGLGNVPVVYTKSGWPSMSTTALQKLVCRVQGTSNENEENELFCEALTSLIAAKSLKHRASKIRKSATAISQMIGRLSLPHSVDREHVGIHRAWSQARLGDDTRAAISAMEGKKLLVLNYQHLGLWALAQLSKCAELKQRVESKQDITTAGVMKLYTGIAEEVTHGDCEVAVETDQQSSHHDPVVKTVRQKYPTAFEISRKLDSAFTHGGGVGGVSHIMLITRAQIDQAKELRKRWYAGHPGVCRWHDEWREQCLTDGVAETMMGRRRRLIFPQEAKRFKWEAAVTEGMKFVITGTASEAVLGSVRQLVTNERLRGLGWKVVLVDDATIVLEGPEYSMDMALPVIQLDATKPFGFDFSVRLKVVGEIVSSVGDLFGSVSAKSVL